MSVYKFKNFFPEQGDDGNGGEKMKGWDEKRERERKGRREELLVLPIISDVAPLRFRVSSWNSELGPQLFFHKSNTSMTRMTKLPPKWANFRPV